MTPADELSAVKRRDMSRLRWERVQRGLTLREVCRSVGISSPALLGYYESGAVQPNLPRMISLSDFYGVPVSTLFAEWAA